MSETGASEATGVACPHCGKEVFIRLAAHIPESQTVKFKVDFEGDYLGAATLGGTITNFADLLKITAKEIGGEVEVFVKAVDYRPREATVEFLVTSVKQ